MNEQCAGGTCEPEGFCSFPDSSCPSGKRFGELGGSLAGTCVGAMPIDGSMEDMELFDADPDAAVDAPIDMMMVAPFCDAVGEPTLVGCWEFENNTNDASGDSNNATATNVTYATGRVGQAVVLQSNSLLAVGDRPSLQPPNITIETWVRSAQTPPASPGRWGIADNDNAWGVFVNSTSVLCSLNGALSVAFALQTNVWTHIACTTDGTTVRMYINGEPQAATVGGSPLGDGGTNTNGVVLAGNSPNGDTFVGAVDQFRIFNVARTQPQICAATGLATCK